MFHWIYSYFLLFLKNTGKYDNFYLMSLCSCLRRKSKENVQKEREQEMTSAKVMVMNMTVSDGGSSMIDLPHNMDTTTSSRYSYYKREDILIKAKQKKLNTTNGRE